MAQPHFRLPLNLPHAATIADRIVSVLAQQARRGDPAHEAVFSTADALRERLAPCRFMENNPPAPEARRLQHDGLALGRTLVAAIAQAQVGGDRLGQCVRNLFECLEHGREGAELSLTAGENPASLQRPVARRAPAADADGNPVTPPPAHAKTSIKATAKKPRQKPAPSLAPVDDQGRPRFVPPAPRQRSAPARRVQRPLDADGRPQASPGVNPDLPPPGAWSPPDETELGPPIDENEFAGLAPVSDEDTPSPNLPDPQPSSPDGPPLSAEDDLGPPLTDDGDFDRPLPGRGRKLGGIIHDDAEDDDWRFDE